MYVGLEVLVSKERIVLQSQVEQIFLSTDGWLMRFYVFLSEVHPYRDDGKVIMKGCVQWNPWKEFHLKLVRSPGRLSPGLLI